MQQYLFKTTGIALAITYITLVVTLNALLRLAVGMQTDTMTRQTIAGGLGLLVIFMPLWWLQWRWLCRQFDTTAVAMPTVTNHTVTKHTVANHHHFQRYVLTVAIVALIGVFAGAGLSVVVLAQMALGLLENAVVGWVQSLVALAAMLIAAGIWQVHWRYVATNAQILSVAKSVG